MKLLTLNTHSLMENDYESKLDIFVSEIINLSVDIIALQEVMQPLNGEIINTRIKYLGEIPLKKGNHLLNVVKELEKRGKKYNCVWLGIKKSYDRFDEGLAILTPHKIDMLHQFTTSPFNDYNNWKTRKVLGAFINKEWYYCVHMGWWENEDSPFEYELKSLINNIEKGHPVWLMGDFNSPAEERNTGYDLVKKSGFYDTYDLAVKKDEGATASKGIDGWNDSTNDEIRIDYIFTNRIVPIESTKVIFDGKNKVSDHRGVLLTKA